MFSDASFLPRLPDSGLAAGSHRPGEKQIGRMTAGRGASADSVAGAAIARAK